MSTPSYKTGDVVLIRPEWEGNDMLFVIVEWWNDDSGLITPLRWNHGPIRPIESVRAEMIEPAFSRPEIRMSRSDGARVNKPERNQ